MASGTTARALLLFGFAFAVRAIYLIEISGSLPFEVLYGDGEGYDRWARGLLADGGAAPDVFYQAPLYPYLLAGVYAFSGPSPALVCWLQAAFGAGACVLLAFAGRHFFGYRAGGIDVLVGQQHGPDRQIQTFVPEIDRFVGGDILDNGGIVVF